MKKLLFVIIVMAPLLYACKDNKDAKKDPDLKDDTKQSIDSTLVTDSTWGPINVNTDFDALKKIYGTANVKDETICGAECVDSVDVTFVYPQTDREVTVYWDDSAYHKKIWMIEAS